MARTLQGTVLFDLLMKVEAFRKLLMIHETQILSLTTTDVQSAKRNRLYILQTLLVSVTHQNHMLQSIYPLSIFSKHQIGLTDLALLKLRLYLFFLYLNVCKLDIITTCGPCRQMIN